ncbi:MULTISPECIES: phage portal protein [Streptomyces]|nr:MULTISPECIES: phage portal protein [Streptomyces]PIB11272.1 phage portal protein [Streptomyces sp. HG99]
MKWTRRLFRRTEERAITSLPWDVGGAMPSQVSSQTAGRIVPLFACWRILADNIASLPVQTFQRNAATRLPNPFLPDLLFRPAARDNLFQWLHKCVVSLAARGNAYGLITARDNFGFPVNIEWLHPDDVWVDEERPTEPIYHWQGMPLPTEDVFHIPWFVMPGCVVGLSPIQWFASTLGENVAATEYGRRWFENGGTPPAVMKNSAKTINPEESEEIRNRLSIAIRSGKPIVIGNDWDFTALDVNPNESQFIETRRLNATAIASIYGVPPGMVGGDQGGGSVTYANVEQQTINLTTLTFRAWLVRIENAVSDQLAGRQMMRFNVDAMIRVDTRTRYEVYSLALQNGWMSVDEVRALENLAPLPNGAGQVYKSLAPQPAPVPPDEQQLSPEGRAFLELLASERDANA